MSGQTRATRRSWSQGQGVVRTTQNWLQSHRIPAEERVGTMCPALGFQRGKLRPPRGAALPKVVLTFEARDQDLHRAGVICRGLLRVCRPDQPQEGQADEGQIPPHRERRPDTDSCQEEGRDKQSREF